MARTRTVGQWFRWWWQWRHLPVVERDGAFQKPLHARRAASLDWRLIRNSLPCASTEVIEMLDFGAASGEEGVTRRLSVGQLEQTASTDGRKGLWLAALAQSVEPGSDQDSVILELGTCLGAGAVSLMLGAGGRGQYVGLEGSPDLAALTGQRLSNTAPRVSVDIRVGPFRDTLPTLLAEQPCFDLVFLDGHHDGSILLDQWERLRPFVCPGGWVVVDDIRWSEDMQAAWNTLAHQPNVEAVDLFRMGALRTSGPGQRTSGGPRRVPSLLLA